MATIPEGYAPGRVIIDQNGNLWLQTAALYDSAGTDKAPALLALTAAGATLASTTTATAAMLNQTGLANGTHTITVGSQTGDDIPLTIQLKDIAGADLTAASTIQAYFASDSAGLDFAATGPDGGLAIGTDGSAMALVANKLYLLTSEADGDIDVVVTEAGTGTWYLVLVKPNGQRIVSGAITFA